MKVINCILILIIGLNLKFISIAQAHDPGLSYAQVQLQQSNILLRLTFSEQDVNSLFESKFDRVKTNDRFSALLATGTDLQIDHTPLHAQDISWSITSSNAVVVTLNFPFKKSGILSIQIPLIKEFSPGHRQHLRIIRSKNEPVLQQIIAPHSGPIFIDMVTSTSTSVFQAYLLEGIRHIGFGYDHILFLVTLLLPAVLILRNHQWYGSSSFLPPLLDTIKIVSIFTVAHSITLTLATMKLLSLPPRLVESLIAASIIIVAINNLWPIIAKTRWLLACGFGLLHGFGFASALTQIGLNQESLMISLLAFNLGVELGQLVIISSLLPLIFMARDTLAYRHWIFRGGSLSIALVASVWLFERSFE